MQDERWIKHYSKSRQILLVGEGDFSFSACLANAFGSASNMIATSLDNQMTVMVKHPTAILNWGRLRSLGGTVLHEVNVHTMRAHPRLLGKKFDRIVFNFPHAGFCFGMREHDSIHIQRHQELLRGFFRNASDMLTMTGEIHVTHKTHFQFSMWEVERLGQEAGLFLVQKVDFTKLEYPGYENKKGDGVDSNNTFAIRQCSTFKFAMLPSHVPVHWCPVWGLPVTFCHQGC